MLHATRSTTTATADAARSRRSRVAYLVCRELGLETDAYTFPYVATWAGGEVKVVDGRRGQGARMRSARSSSSSSPSNSSRLEVRPGALDGSTPAPGTAVPPRWRE